MMHLFTYNFFFFFSVFVSCLDCVTDRFLFLLLFQVAVVKKNKTKHEDRQRYWDGGSKRVKEPQFSLFITFTTHVREGVCATVCAVCMRKRASTDDWRECACASWTVPKISGYHLQMLFTFYNVPITHISLSQYKQKDFTLVTYCVLCLLLASYLRMYICMYDIGF